MEESKSGMTWLGVLFFVVILLVLLGGGLGQCGGGFWGGRGNCGGYAPEGGCTRAVSYTHLTLPTTPYV